MIIIDKKLRTDLNTTYNKLCQIIYIAVNKTNKITINDKL